MRNRSRLAGALSLACALGLAGVAGAQPKCLDCDGGKAALAGTVKVTKYQPDNGGAPIDCRVLALDAPACMQCGAVGKRLIKELQLSVEADGPALPAAGRFLVTGVLGSPSPLSACRDVELAATRFDAPSGAAAVAPGSKDAFPPYARRSGRLGYGMPDKVVSDPATWKHDLKKALANLGLTVTRVEFYKGGAYPVLFVQEDPANVDLMTLQRKDVETADRYARTLLKANGDAAYEVVTEGRDRFRYNAPRAEKEAGFEIFTEE